MANYAWRIFQRGEQLAGYAYTRTFSETISRVISEPTDLVIAHTQPMLAPAFFAAEKLGCHWSFDFEDVLSEEYGEGIQKDSVHQGLVRYVERTFIPRARFVTTASGCFSNWIERNTGVRNATLVRNVPYQKEAPAQLCPGYPVSRPHLSLYWFSQTIGPLRGIEDILQAIALANCPVELHLRGEVLPFYRETLQGWIQKLRLQQKVFIHGRIAPGELLAAASEHDLGLGLMQPCCLNHELAVPNKIYAYMMAGLGVLATTTQGHASVFQEAPGIGFLYNPGDVRSLAERLEFLSKNPSELLKCRTRAFELARNRFHWETERQTLLNLVEGLQQ